MMILLNAQRVTRALVALAVCALAATRPLRAQAPAKTPPSKEEAARSAAFDRVDRDSRTLLATIRCAISTGQLRASGAFGPLDSLGNYGICVWRGGVRLGAFFAPDTGFTQANRLRLVNLATGARDTAPLDTAALLAEAHAGRDGGRLGFAPYARDHIQYAPFSMRTDGDSIEVWLLPTSLLLGGVPKSLGGERGFVYAPNGRTLVREIDAYAKLRPVTIPDTGAVVLKSLEPDIPLLSELFVVNVLSESGRQAGVETDTFLSMLVGNGPAGFWAQMRRKH